MTDMTAVLINSLLFLQAEARSGIVKALASVNFQASERVVRINSVGSGLEKEDLTAVLSGPVKPDAILIPKVGSADELRWVASHVQSCLGSAVRLG